MEPNIIKNEQIITAVKIIALTNQEKGVRAVATLIEEYLESLDDFNNIEVKISSTKDKDTIGIRMTHRPKVTEFSFKFT